MDIYLHDSAASFRIVLRGDLAGDRVRELECVWTTGSSVLNGRNLVVDISGLAGADAQGSALLGRMRAAGAVLMEARRPPTRPRGLWALPLALLGVRTR